METKGETRCQEWKPKVRPGAREEVKPKVRPGAREEVKPKVRPGVRNGNQR